jgi:two-component SAPR family response regulator
LSAHENPQLSSLFALAITPLAKILAEFNTKNAVIDSYTQFFAALASLDEDARPGVTEWRSGLHLDLTMPELRKLIRDAEDDLMAHPSLSSIEESQHKLRTHGVGYVLLQLLAIQVQLGEPLNLNGDTLKTSPMVLSVPFPWKV